MNKPEEIKIQLLYRTCFAHPTVMMDKQYLIENNLRYNNEYKCSQDYELWSRIVDKSNAYIIPKIGLNYRMHAKQATSAKRQLQIDFTTQIINNNIHTFGIKGDAGTKRLMHIFGGLEELNKENYLMVSNEIDKLLQSNNTFDKKILKRVLYNRFFK